MADTVAQLIDKIELALDGQSDVVVDPATARRLIAEDIGAAVNAFVIGRITTGTGYNSAPVTTIIQ